MDVFFLPTVYILKCTARCADCKNKRNPIIIQHSLSITVNKVETSCELQMSRELQTSKKQEINT